MQRTVPYYVLYCGHRAYGAGRQVAETGAAWCRVCDAMRDVRAVIDRRRSPRPRTVGSEQPRLFE